MCILGLTGGIASGKSTVAEAFREEGLALIDLDAIAHKVTEKGRWGYKRIVKAFGRAAVLDSDGNLDRAKVADLVFSDRKERSKLNRATHLPIAVDLVCQLVYNWVTFTPLVVLDAPLLFETKLNRITSFNVCVWCREDQQLQRLVARDHCSAEHARSRIESQMPLDGKREMCDTVIDSSGTKAECIRDARQVAKAYRNKKGRRKFLFF